jgi:hypothetical protein
LVEELRSIARPIPELPLDWASQHAHYLYGSKAMTLLLADNFQTLEQAGFRTILGSGTP